MQRKHKCQLPATQPLTAPKAPQTKQGWFYFSREWQRKGLVDQQNLTPHPCEEKSELQGVCEHHQVLRKRSGEPCSRPDLLHDLGQINIFILKTNGWNKINGATSISLRRYTTAAGEECSDYYKTLYIWRKLVSPGGLFQVTTQKGALFTNARVGVGHG